MKPEIKFNVFVNENLRECMTVDSKWSQVFLAAMDGLGLLQRYCLVYRMTWSSEYLLSAQTVTLGKCSDGLNIKPGSTIEASLRYALRGASRIQCVVDRLGQDGGVKVGADFFAKGRKSAISRLELTWFLKDGHFLITIELPFVFAPQAQPASY
ncbi:MAG: hypothetical protein WC750_00215 [Patescibacteria group bacterium]|jgi:hypothetical protein